MPKYFYRITCILQDGSSKQGIRESSVGDIDIVWLNYKQQAEFRFENKLEDFDCVMMSTHHRDVKRYLRDNGVKQIRNVPDEDTWWDKEPDLSKPPPKTTSRKEDYAKRPPVKRWGQQED